MMTKTITASAPGSIMLMGEHAVLYNKPAIVAAVNRRIFVTITPIHTTLLTIQSSYGNYTGDIALLPEKNHWTYDLITFIQFSNKQLNTKPNGLNIHIESGFEGAVGLGSSTALLCATGYAILAMINQYNNHDQHKDDCFKLCQQFINSRNNKQEYPTCSMSGYAASIYGDVQLIENNQRKQSLSWPIPFYLVYIGYKTPTEQVLAQLHSHYQDAPQERKQINHAIAICTQTAINAIKSNDIDTLNLQLNHNQQLLTQLCVCDTITEKLIQQLNQLHPNAAIKISGAGCGDCILVCAQQPDHIDLNDKQAIINVDIEKQGAHIC